MKRLKLVFNTYSTLATGQNYRTANSEARKGEVRVPISSLVPKLPSVACWLRRQGKKNLDAHENSMHFKLGT